MSQRLIVVAMLWLVAVAHATAAEPKQSQSEPPTLTVEQLAAKAKPSVVIVTVDDRNSQPLGMGSGFVISSDGLIATNLHVIAEARPIAVQFANGKKFDVVAVHATDKAMDLAILKIDAKDLPALELGNSDTVKQGQPVVAMGNPLGLKHSVVAGVVSAKEEIEGRPMIQIAMPIEKGNSGGPLLDMQGRVQGLVTLKSLVKDDLGFAVVVNPLKQLIERPNPVPMAQWQTIGTIDLKQWTPIDGARWRQRAGRILAEEPGQGFGGRSLCVSKLAVPEVPFEISVSVKFAPEEGAAGLIFHSDGGQKHYGFYPSNGRLRLSRFNGADVYSWKVLTELPHAAYRPNDWNQLKVRVEAERILCFVNGQLAIESTDAGFKSGAVGLAKFRDTKAQFKQFQVGKELAGQPVPSSEAVKQINEFAAEVTADMGGSGELVGKLSSLDQHTLDVLRAEAKQLEQRAHRLKELAVAVHARRVQADLKRLIESDARNFDLLRAALLIAKLDNEDVDVEEYVTSVDRMANEIKASVKTEASETERLTALNDYLFKQRGFHGSRTNYYHRSNSYLNEVLDDREGLPITLAVLHMELAKRLDLKVVGVPLPGHFVVRFDPREGDSKLVDVFDGGKDLNLTDVKLLLAENVESRIADNATLADVLKALDKEYGLADSRSIAIRMLSNLRNISSNERDDDATARYLDAMLVIDPDAVEARARRIDLSVRRSRWKDAISDIDWMLEKRPAGMDIEAVTRMRKQLEAELKSMM